MLKDLEISIFLQAFRKKCFVLEKLSLYRDISYLLLGVTEKCDLFFSQDLRLRKHGKATSVSRTKPLTGKMVLRPSSVIFWFLGCLFLYYYVKQGFFFPGRDWRVPPSSKNFVNSPHLTLVPVFGPRLVPPPSRGSSPNI